MRKNFQAKNYAMEVICLQSSFLDRDLYGAGAPVARGSFQGGTSMLTP